MSSPSALLGVQPGAGAEELRAAYKKRALETHPDKGGDADQFRAIRKAYELLTKLQTKDDASGLASQKPPERAWKDTPVPRTPPPPAKSEAPKFSAGKHVGVTAAAVFVGSQPQKKRPKSMEQEINMAFNKIPETTLGAGEGADASPGQAKARRTAGGSPGVGSNADEDGPDAAHAVAAGLWERLVKLSAAQREVAIQALSSPLKLQLRSYLASRRTARKTAGAGTSPHGSSAKCPGNGTPSTVPGRTLPREGASSVRSGSSSSSSSRSSSSSSSRSSASSQHADGKAAQGAPAQCSKAAGSAGPSGAGRAGPSGAGRAATSAPQASAQAAARCRQPPPPARPSVPVPRAASGPPGSGAEPAAAAPGAARSSASTRGPEQARTQLMELADRILKTPSREERRKLLEVLSPETRLALEQHLQTKHAARVRTAPPGQSTS